jgi:excisionase family DNA binding protein
VVLILIRPNYVNLYQPVANLFDVYGEHGRIHKMPTAINGQKYYRTSEACRMVGISRTTLLRWLRQGNLKLPEYRDRRKWRLFTADDVDKLNKEANRISSISQLKSEDD